MKETLISEYKSFLDKGKTERECVCQIIEKDFGVGGRSIWLATFKTM